MGAEKRQFIAIKFEIDLPLKRHEVDEAVQLLEGVLSILKQAQATSPATVAVDPVGAA